jgi:MFS family permease
MTTYALDTLHLPATISFSLIILNGGLSATFEALSGWLSDRFGRKPVRSCRRAARLLDPAVLLGDRSRRGVGALRARRA